MTGTFALRARELREHTGNGELLSGSVTVDQVYAHFQHERMDLRHPRGGHARFLAVPLETRFRMYLGWIARDIFDDGGKRAMARAMVDLSDQVEWHAPVEFWDLRRSGHPQVHQGIRQTYDRSPTVHRLSPAELKAKSRIRYMKLPDRLKGWIWWHVQRHRYPPPRHVR
jgi:hypothetical protein